jgi:5-methylcytosine-specific restriction endonuclease McrA
MSIAIGLALKGNKAGRRWETLVGYTLNDSMKHLKKTMPEGYCWQDFLQGELHIDHKVPKSVFNYTKPEHIDFKRAWASSNLQLLPAKENLIKHNKLTRPFQPALQI